MYSGNLKIAYHFKEHSLSTIEGQINPDIQLFIHLVRLLLEIDLFLYNSHGVCYCQPSLCEARNLRGQSLTLSTPLVHTTTWQPLLRFS